MLGNWGWSKHHPSERGDGLDTKENDYTTEKGHKFKPRPMSVDKLVGLNWVVN